MHREHAILLDELRLAAGRPAGMPPDSSDSFGSSGRPCYFVRVPERRAIAKAWASEHGRAEAALVLEVVDSLLTGESYEERTMAGFVLGYHRRARAAVRPADLDRWLGLVNGWAEVDSLCQSLFPAEQMLADWGAWRSLLERLAVDPDRNRRRAALVLLTGPVKQSGEERLKGLAFANVDRLRAERDPLIAKAVSWLLRALAERHPQAVAAYLGAAGAQLPAIAVREARTKLATGRKTVRR